MHAESIESIKFNILGPEIIKRISVGKLIVPDTYNEEGYPIDGGVMDQRLGVIDPGFKCKTCGGSIKSCPGHFGHIELVRPVVHPEFARIIQIMLQSTCMSCHRLLLDEKHLLKKFNKNPDEIKSDLAIALEDALSKKSDMVMKRIRKAKGTSKCMRCGTKQNKIKFERPTMFYSAENKMKPDEIMSWLSKIPDEDILAIGIDPKNFRPEWAMLSFLLVPPVNARPSITLETGERSEDDLTHKLVEIIRINKKLEQDIDAGTPQIIIDDVWELLQYHVTTYFNNETPGVPVARHRSSRPLKTLTQRLKGKEGRIRYNLSGKRVNYSARTVVSSDSSLNPNQVGVPRRIAETLTMPFYVTHWNLEEAKKFLQNSKYPGIVNIITKEGIKKRVSDTNREELVKEIVPGYFMERHIIDGDFVLFNRQPTLHRLSIMAHEVKVLPGKTLRFNVSVAQPYNADFDGDAMNLHAPQSVEAQAEARYLMQPKMHIISPRDGLPIIALEEDHIMGLYLLTADDSYFSKEEASIMLANIGIYELPEKRTKDELYSGKDIFSMLLPKDFNMKAKTKGGEVVIKNGKLVEGMITNSMITAFRKSPLLVEFHNKYGGTATMEFILNLGKLALRTAYTKGVTLSIRDYHQTKEMMTMKESIIKDANTTVEKLITSYRDGTLEQLLGRTKKQTLEQLTREKLVMARETAKNELNRILPDYNNAIMMAKAEARGSALNIVQTSIFLGQQEMRGKRPNRGYTGRLLPMIRRGDKSPGAHGFVSSSFLEGLTPKEFFIHSMGARDSAVSKILVVPISGYMYRRLLNAMQDFYVDKDLSVKGASGALIQTIYGGDGIDTSKNLTE